MSGSLRHRVVMTMATLALTALLGGCVVYPGYPGYYGGGYYGGGYYGYGGGGVVTFGGGDGWHEGGWHHR